MLCLASTENNSIPTWHYPHCVAFCWQWEDRGKNRRSHIAANHKDKVEFRVVNSFTASEMYICIWIKIQYRIHLQYAIMCIPTLTMSLFIPFCLSYTPKWTQDPHSAAAWNGTTRTLDRTKRRETRSFNTFLISQWEAGISWQKKELSDTLNNFQS